MQHKLSHPNINSEKEAAEIACHQTPETAPLNSPQQTGCGNRSRISSQPLPWPPGPPGAGTLSDLILLPWETEEHLPSTLKPAPPEVRIDGVQLEIYQFISSPLSRQRLRELKKQRLDPVGHPLFPGATIWEGRSRTRITVAQRLRKRIYRLCFNGTAVYRWATTGVRPHQKAENTNCFTEDEEASIQASGESFRQVVLQSVETAISLILSDLHLFILDLGVSTEDIEPPRIEIKRFEACIDFRFDSTHAAKQMVDNLHTAIARYGARWQSSTQYDPALGKSTLYIMDQAMDISREEADGPQNFAKPYPKTDFVSRLETIQLNPRTPVLSTPEALRAELGHLLDVHAWHLLKIRDLTQMPIVTAKIPEIKIHEALNNYGIDSEKFKLTKFDKFIVQVRDTTVYDRSLIPNKKERLGDYHYKLFSDKNTGILTRGKAGRGTGRRGLKPLNLRGDFFEQSIKYKESQLKQKGDSK